MRSAIRPWIVVYASFAVGPKADLHAEEPDLVYTIRLVATRPAKVVVSLETVGADDGENVFRAGSSVVSGLPLISDLHFESVFGKPLEAEVVDDSVWLVKHAQRERLRAVWTIVDADPSTPSPTQVVRRQSPVRDDAFCLVGLDGLLHAIRPQPWTPPVSDRDTRTARLVLSGFLERGWSIATTLGDGTVFDTTAEALSDAVTVAGPLVVDERAVGGRWVRVVGTGESTAPARQMVSDVLAKTLAAATACFDDRSATPVLAIVTGASSADATIGGEAVDDGFVIRVPEGLVLTPGGADARRLADVVAHETYHHWNGHLVRPVALDRDVAWFVEGVTDYASRRLLLRSGVWSPNEYVDDLNRELLAYATNPRRGAPACDVEYKRHVDDDFATVPYELGNYAAFLLDRRIRHLSAGARSIDDFMRGLFVETQRSRRTVSNDLVLAKVAEFTSSEFAQQLRALVVDGGSLRPDVVDFRLGLRLRSSEARVRGTDQVVEVPQVELGRGDDESLRDEL